MALTPLELLLSKPHKTGSTWLREKISDNYVSCAIGHMSAV